MKYYIEVTNIVCITEGKPSTEFEEILDLRIQGGHKIRLHKDDEVIFLSNPFGHKATTVIEGFLGDTCWSLGNKHEVFS